MLAKLYSIMCGAFVRNPQQRSNYSPLITRRSTVREVLVLLKKKGYEYLPIKLASLDIVNILLWGEKHMQKNGGSHSLQGIPFLIIENKLTKLI